MKRDERILVPDLKDIEDLMSKLKYIHKVPQYKPEV
jgi:hypothetical protein